MFQRPKSTLQLFKVRRVPACAPFQGLDGRGQLGVFRFAREQFAMRLACDRNGRFGNRRCDRIAQT